MTGGGLPRVLVTGAAGRIGSAFRSRYGGRYRFRLVDRRPVEDPDGHEACQADLVDPDEARRACEGMDAVVHLAADPSPSAGFYESLLALNIQMTYNLFEASAEAGCRRVVFASSIHTVNAYPLDVQIHPDDPVRPGDLYGVTKVFGEALASYYGHCRGVSSIAIRIGAFGDESKVLDCGDPRMLALWVSESDLSQLIHLAIEAPQEIRSLVVNGVSDNQFKRLDISSARVQLGYSPQHNSFQITRNCTLQARRPDEPDV